MFERLQSAGLMEEGCVQDADGRSTFLQATWKIRVTSWFHEADVLLCIQKFD